MCDADGDPCPVWKERTRTARKSHKCLGCLEAIEPGHRYNETRSLFDGSWSTWKHCARCWAMFGALAEKTREDGFYVVAIDPSLNCGETWLDNFGEPPPEVAALAFMLPGEQVPA